jgi:glycosyltransferase involved in cell wall biosynthesis
MAGGVTAPRILFVAGHHPGRAPNQRFRFEQYLGYLQERGFQCDVSWLIAPEDALFYRPGRIAEKLRLVTRAVLTRLGDAMRSGRYDLVFVSREAFMVGPAIFERAMAARTPLVFDFDDSIWLLHTSEANRRFGWLKMPGKTANIIRMASLVFAGNAYLADYARQWNDRVHVVPTTIDTDVYPPAPSQRKPGPIRVGWSGSITTISYFVAYAVPILTRLKERHGDLVDLRVIGDELYRNDALGIGGQPWRLETEVEDLQEFDIGIMPLPDDAWARGKCGLKALQYMALEVPTVLSPIGVNTEIVTDGVNGYLADGPDDWIDRISRLIESENLRRRLGAAGRRTVEERYSVRSWRGEYARLLTEAARQL